MSRSHSVKSSEVRISIRFRVRSQIVLCYFPRVISDGWRRWSWGNRWTFNGWGRRMYRLSPTSVAGFEKSDDDGAASFVSSVWLCGTCCVVVASCVSVTSCITTCWFFPHFLASRVRQSVFQNLYYDANRGRKLVTATNRLEFYVDSSTALQHMRFKN